MSRRYYRPQKYRRTPSRKKYTTYKKEKNRDWIVYCLLGLVIALLFNFTYNQGEKSCTTSLEDINFYDVNTREEIVLQKEYELYPSPYPWENCWDVEYFAKNIGKSKVETKRDICDGVCKSNDLSYGYFVCKEKKLNCYCIK